MATTPERRIEKHTIIASGSLLRYQLIDRFLTENRNVESAGLTLAAHTDKPVNVSPSSSRSDSSDNHVDIRSRQ